MCKSEAMQTAVNALYGILNIEGATKVGAEAGAFTGLDLPYHFDRVREAISALEAEGYTFE